MRNRMIVAAALGLMPALLAAQRIPVKIPTSIPREPRNDPGEPRPAPIARQLAITRSHYWFESVALASYVQAPGFGVSAGPGGQSLSLSGTSTHVEYRDPLEMHPFAPTLDLSIAEFGGLGTTLFLPSSALSTVFAVEPGVRYRINPLSENYDSFLGRFSPFLDMRANYMRASNSFVLLSGSQSAQQTLSGYQLSGGVGAVAGAGTQIFITHAISVSTELSTVGDRMTVMHGTSPTYPISGHYWLRWYRLSLGMNYNHVSYRQMAQRVTP